MTAASKAPKHVEVVIIGAGFAGLGAALALLDHHRDSFLVLERAGEPGGTWRDNVYPGVACDIPSPLYALSTRLNPTWTQAYAPGAEIHSYLANIADEPALRQHIRYNTPMTRARWHEDEHLWHITTPDTVITCRVLIVGAGRFSTPHIPDVRGLDGFTGPIIHSARWPAHFDPSGLRVGLIGTGASAIQIAPHLARDAASTVVFQRSAPWVIDKDDRPYTAEERDVLTDHAQHQRLRQALFEQNESLFDGRNLGTPLLAELRNRGLAQLNAAISDTALREALTPDTEPGCRRILFSSDYYDCFERGTATLEASALARVEGNTAVGDSGNAYRLDALVFATGFEVARQPYADLITGRNGHALAAAWAAGLHAARSVAVPGFPNMFVLNGPNATLGHNSSLLTIETQIDYVLQALSALDRRATPLEAKHDAAKAQSRALTQRIEHTVWASGCSSWYLNADGSPGLLWPGTVAEFRETNGTFTAGDYLPETRTPAIQHS